MTDFVTRRAGEQELGILGVIWTSTAIIIQIWIQGLARQSRNRPGAEEPRWSCFRRWRWQGLWWWWGWQEIMLYFKARHGFVEKDSSRDSAYGLSGLYIHLSKHHHHQLQTSSSSSSSTSTPSILISMLSLWWYLFCDSWQQNPNKRANSRAEGWN